MSILADIRPKEPLRHLRWFDMLIVTAILFGQFAYRSTQLYIASLMSASGNGHSYRRSARILQ